VTISKDDADRYFISILVKDEIEHLPHNENSIGADLGLKSFVALSDGEFVGNPKFFAKDEKKLARAQVQNRCLSSANRQIEEGLLFPLMTNEKRAFDSGDSEAERQFVQHEYNTRFRSHQQPEYASQAILTCSLLESSSFCGRSCSSILSSRNSYGKKKTVIPRATPVVGPGDEPMKGGENHVLNRITFFGKATCVFAFGSR
jgi:hypothetical protein